MTDVQRRAAAKQFAADWFAISPTIFGVVFESTLNPETRQSGGMHYTSIENIHKVIDPLFLDGLKAELAAIATGSIIGILGDKLYNQERRANRKKPLAYAALYRRQL